MTTPHALRNRRGRLPGLQRGLSLVELMVSITIGLLLLAGMVTLYVNQSRSYTALERAAAMLENGRYALHQLADDLQLAGFYGEWGPGAATGTVFPAPCATGLTDLQSALPWHIQAATPDDVSACISSVLTGTAIVVVRRLSTTVEAVGSIDAGNQARYFQISRCQDDLPGTFTLHNDPTELNLTRGNCTALAPVRRVLVHIYHIAPNNVGTDGIPTLKRAVLGTNGQFAIEPIAEGIQNLQFEYLRADGTDCSSGSGCTPAEWGDVMAVRLHLLARTSEADPGYEDNKLYHLAGVTVNPNGDGFRRHLFSEYVRLMNPAGRRE